MFRTVCVSVVAMLAISASGVAQDIDFARDVRPILAANCFRCHGPDSGSREAGLRLDLRDSALQPAESGQRAIVPGKPEASELIRRIESPKNDVVMPPPSSKKALTDDQKRILARWIKAGAPYQEHWSFVAPRAAALPKTNKTDWARNPIDAFVLAKLEAHRLEPSPQADPLTLLRRVSLDLIGLPPTIEEIDSFLKACRGDDKSGVGEFDRQRVDAAYADVVAKLLQSPQYGERWARRWLDLARYADTNGYEKDRARTIWPYRDWVIKALNADMPFDQFTIEQLAGDMLPNATPDQRIATGFHRNTMLNEEGGIDPLEFRFHAMTDRVATTGTTWLGLTVGCAQCHTHKYDPITHREYYQLLAFLNNADEPDFDLPNESQANAYRQKLAEADRLQQQLEQHWPVEGIDPNNAAVLDNARNAAVTQKLTAWLQQQREQLVRWRPVRPRAAKSNLPLLTMQSDHSILASGDTTKSDLYELTFEEVPIGTTAWRLEALPDESLPAHGPGLTYYEGTKGDFFLSEFVLSANDQALKIRSASETYSKNRFGANPVTAKHAIDGDLQTGWSVDGRQGERHVAVFVLDQPLSKTETVTLKLHFGRHFASSLGKFRISVTTDARAPVPSELPDSLVELVHRKPDALNDAERQQLRVAFLMQAPELKMHTERIRQLRKQSVGIATLVMQERPENNPRPTHIHHRGEFLQTKDKVEAAIPAFLPPLSKNLPTNRLSFARWLVAPENPLTARVTVNRHWAAFFGRGLVPTLQDFGIQGELPSHPELLDWLAVHFREDGWSQKRLHQLIVMSATYRQQSAISPMARQSRAMQVDPENKWLWHAPRLRLEAEIMRDSVLRASGLLSLKLGGPSVFPPQPASITTEGTYGAMTWKASEGEDRYRRSLYTFSKRTAPFAMLTTFDAPSGEACLARRDVSNTPLQALTLLNDIMFTEASQASGKSLAVLTGTIDEKLDVLWKRTLSRLPNAEERTAAKQYFESQQRRLASKELDASKLNGTEAPASPDQAVWTLLSRALFNVDEMLTR